MTERQIAHLLRRATPAAHPRRMATLSGQTLTAAIGSVLQTVPEAGELPWSQDDGPDLNDGDDWGRVAQWWVQRMSQAEAGLADRMAWFWHNHFTTADESYNNARLTVDQLEVLYRHGLGDLRTLLHTVVTSGAMLRYLDAAGSEAFNPNENLARELMELYTIGPGNYDENDVRGAARALAGWEVDDEQASVWFNESRAFVAPLVLFGEQRNWDTSTLIDALCDNPATAERIAAKLWTHLVGTAPDENDAKEMGAWWSAHELQILPLVEQILRSDGFAQAEFNRSRSAVEWVIGTLSAFDPDQEWEPLEPWELENLGQRPFAPPSPAGWPTGDYWTRPGSLLPRLQFAQDIELTGAARRVRTTAAILAAMGLPPDDQSAPAISSAFEASADQFDLETRQTVAWRLALIAPTFQNQ